MDKVTVIEKIMNHPELWAGVAKHYITWDIVELILEAAGYFEIVEAAITMCKEPMNTYDMENMYETLKKAGALDE